jgi:hypothetical protein
MQQHHLDTLEAERAFNHKRVWIDTAVVKSVGESHALLTGGPSSPVASPEGIYVSYRWSKRPDLAKGDVVDLFCPSTA